ncbi:unnamed protein product [Menidia menidia]|uniref:(Atlantic silverside) hypothetical protein n=1 Tax=Menidia menidia TaxID=238744 RepID=A0A8S4APC2_9TELE|nr:unnamed protein product [Menidia menidia]
MCRCLQWTGVPMGREWSVEERTNASEYGGDSHTRAVFPPDENETSQLVLSVCLTAGAKGDQNIFNPPFAFIAASVNDDMVSSQV